MDLRGKIDHSNSNCNFLVIWVGILILCAFVCLIRICCFKVKDIKGSIFQEEFVEKIYVQQNYRSLTNLEA